MVRSDKQRSDPSLTSTDQFLLLKKIKKKKKEKKEEREGNSNPKS